MDVGLLLGRDRELSVLVDALDGAGRSQGGLVVLVGEPGIGKTALLGEIARIATGRGWVTALGRAHHDHTEAPPYWPWIQILRRLRRVGVLADDHEWLLRALSPTDDTDAGGPGRAPEHVARSRFEIADRMVQALADSAADRPLLIGLDDVHAADPSSLRMLEFLAAVLDDLPLAVVAASRAPVPGTLVETLLVETLRHPAARELVIPGLTAPDVATFLQATHAEDAALADDVWHLTAGNPLYVREVARMLSEGGDDRSGRFPVRLTAALRSRLSSLDPPARRLLDALAVVGEEADVDLLAAMAGGDIEPALAQATGAGIVAVTAAGQGRAARYCHPLLREAVYTDLSAADRVAWHERAASTLAASTAPPLDALAVHLCAAARPETAPRPSTRPARPRLGPNGSTPTTRRPRTSSAGEPRSRCARPPRPATTSSSCWPRRTSNGAPATSARRSTPTGAATCQPTRRDSGTSAPGRRWATRWRSASRARSAPAGTTARSCSSSGRSTASTSETVSTRSTDRPRAWRCSPGRRRRWRAPASSSTTARVPNRWPRPPSTTPGARGTPKRWRSASSACGP